MIHLIIDSFYRRPAVFNFSIFFNSEDTLKLDVGREYFYTIWRIFEYRKEVISASGMKVESFNVCPA